MCFMPDIENRRQPRISQLRRTQPALAFIVCANAVPFTQRSKASTPALRGCCRTEIREQS